MRSLGVQVNAQSRIIEYQNIITSSSPETALDVAFRLLEKLTTTQNMLELKTRMGFSTD